MDTNKKELNTNELDTNELNTSELEKVNGCGPITGFRSYLIPDRKKKTDETEQKDN